MRIYRSQVPRIAQDIINSLRQNQDLELSDENVPEAEKDIAAILELYLKNDYRILEEAKDIVERRGMTHSDLGRVKRELFEKYQHPSGDEAVRWLSGQICECFMASRFIDEVFTDDQILKRKVLDLLRKHIIDESVLDREVRERLKNLQEGTNAWTIQYQKTMREIRRKHGLA